MKHATSRCAAAAAAAMALLAPISAQANLITNGSNDAALVAGQITGWTEVVGTAWTQRSASPDAFDGTHYFFAGGGADGTLRQVVDVSSLAAGIDSGQLAFDFSGFVRTFEQTPSDTARIVVQFLSASNGVLDTFDSGAIVNSLAWQEVEFSSVAQASTRFVQIDLLSHRNSGSNNDGYFDALSLNARALTVPEPATYALLLIGAAFAGFGSRKRALR